MSLAFGKSPSPTDASAIAGANLVEALLRSVNYTRDGCRAAASLNRRGGPPAPIKGKRALAARPSEHPASTRYPRKAAFTGGY